MPASAYTVHATANQRYQRIEVLIYPTDVTEQVRGLFLETAVLDALVQHLIEHFPHVERDNLVLHNRLYVYGDLHTKTCTLPPVDLVEKTVAQTLKGMMAQSA